MMVSEVHSVVSSHANAWSKNMGNSMLSVLSGNGVVSVESARIVVANVSLCVAGIVSSARSDTLKRVNSSVRNVFIRMI